MYSNGFSMERTKLLHRAPLKQTSKSSPPKQNIVLFLHSSTKVVAPLCLHSNFTTKVEIMYWIESDDVFLEITIVWDEKKVDTLKSGFFFVKSSLVILYFSYF